MTLTSNGRYKCSPYDLLAFSLSEIIRQVEGSELTNQLSGDEYCVKFILLLLRASLILMWILHSINSFGVTSRVRKKRNLSDTSFELITSYTIPIFVFFFLTQTP